MDQETLVHVEIQGRTYRLRSEGDPAAVKEIAAFVDARMEQIAEQTTTADTARIAILAALNIAGELFDARAGRGAPPAQATGQRDRELCRILDEVLVA